MIDNSHKRYRPTKGFIVMSISIILLMFSAHRILYVRYIPQFIIIGLTFIVFLFYFSQNHTQFIHQNKFNFLCTLLLSLIFLYDQIWVGEVGGVGILYTLLKIGCSVLILTASIKNKRWLMDLFARIVKIIVGMALLGWILFLLNIPLPHFTDLSDPFYTHTVYYIFNLNGFPEYQLLPRFAGPFLEPGHLGTMCVFILYYERFNLTQIGNIILLISVLLSFSLAAYGLMVGAVLLTLYSRGKWKWCIVITGGFIACGIGAMVYNGGDNPINQAIVARLEMDENGEIAGNNRTSMNFDNAYKRFIGSSDMILGVGNKAFGKREDGSDNITIGCATYKRYFFLRGIVGMVLIILFLIIYCAKYYNKSSIGFFIVYVVANCIRDYPTMEMWMYVYILVIPLLGTKRTFKIYQQESQSQQKISL